MKYTFALLALFFALLSTHPQLAIADDMDDMEMSDDMETNPQDNPMGEEEAMEEEEIAEDESDEAL